MLIVVTTKIIWITQVFLRTSKNGIKNNCVQISNLM